MTKPVPTTEVRYIPLSEVLAYLTDGWAVVPMSMPHGAYSALAWHLAKQEGFL